ncbi:MAG: hypothetical protein R3190_16190, partial [Thermoanaerobaculia bacterium]|nr:hypothetical protein [Thermoanaerobaculia bacterium]
AEETPIGASAGLSSYAGPDCTDSLGSLSEPVPHVMERGVWTRQSRRAWTPAGAGSGRMTLILGKEEVGGLVIAEYDSLYVPEPGRGLGIAAAFAALAAIGPRSARVANRRSGTTES